MADIISIYPASVVASPADTDVVYGAADPAGTPADALFTISSLRQSLYPAFTAPVDGDYAWINQGGASVTVNANGSICLYAPATGDSLRVRKKAAPATPYTMTAGFMATGNQQGETSFGIGWRESGSGKLIIVRMLSGSQLRITKYNSPTSGNSDYTSPSWVFPFGLVWFQIEDDGVNRISRISADGFNFLNIHSVGDTDFITADEILFYASAGSSQDAQMTLHSWAEV